jgi:transcriptional regulator with PAS, ATPase and Fis domain
MLDWAKTLSCAVTVCDTDGIVIYQNEKSKATFAAYGDLIGKSLKDCHKPGSWEIIQKLMNEHVSNSYTIEKNGVKKLILQTPWYLGTNLAGLVELSIELPSTLPHFIR